MTLKEVKPKKRTIKRTISLRSLMALGFGGLVFLSVGGVLAISVAANFANTFSLLNRQTLQLISGMENAIAEEISEVEFALTGLEKFQIEQDLRSLEDDRWTPTLTALLRSVRVIEAVTLTDINGQQLGLFREPKGGIKTIPLATEGKGDSASWPSLGRLPVWIEPEVRGNVLFHNASQLLFRDGKPVARIKASIGAHSINRIVSSVGKGINSTAFILDDKERLIAYSADAQLLNDKPALSLQNVSDPALKRYLGAQKLEQFFDKDGKISDIVLSRTDGEDENYLFITKKISLFSPKPYTIGAYFKDADTTAELRRAGNSALVGLGALLLALLTAIWFSNRLSKPMRQIAIAADKFSNLELDDFDALPRSRVREIDTQTSAINSMHSALSEFRRYVPQKLVQRILDSGTEVTRSVEREVTVMFTDIANFTEKSEHLDAPDVIAMLNEHFELVSKEITASSGTIDKYLGDGVMAFWGAPESDSNHAKHAVQAAIAVAASFQEYCDEQRAVGADNFGLRIGIHTGRAIVGNIGGEGRVNYTVVGHTVNVANRIEQLGKTLLDNEDVVIGVSAQCYEAAGRPKGFDAAGSHLIRGSSTPVSIYVLNRQENSKIKNTYG